MKARSGSSAAKCSAVYSFTFFSKFFGSLEKMTEEALDWISENPRFIRNAGYVCIGALLLGAIRRSGLANRIRRNSDLVRSDFEERRRLRVAFEGFCSRGSLKVSHVPWIQRNFSFLFSWSSVSNSNKCNYLQEHPNLNYVIPY